MVHSQSHGAPHASSVQGTSAVRLDLASEVKALLGFTGLRVEHLYGG